MYQIKMIFIRHYNLSKEFNKEKKSNCVIHLEININNVIKISKNLLKKI